MSRKYEHGAQRRRAEIAWCRPLAGRQAERPRGRAHWTAGSPPLPGPVPEPDAGRDKPRVVFKGVLSHHLGAKRRGLAVSEELQPESEIVASGLFCPLLIGGQLRPLFLCRRPPPPASLPSARPAHPPRALFTAGLHPSWLSQMLFPCLVHVY